MEIKEQYVTLRRKANGLHSSIFSGALWISGDVEAEYFLSGYATELLDIVCLNSSFGNNAKVYGVVANKKDRGRYVWIYLYSHNHIWRCYCIAEAYKVISSLKEYNNARDIELKFYEKLKVEQRKLSKNLALKNQLSTKA